MSEITDIDISSTYKGFRLQALYCVYLALKGEDHWYYIPEKNEDLTIQDEKRNTRRLVQVKSSVNNITLSTFEPEQKLGFFKRAEQHIKDDKDIEIFAVCFGTVSPELLRAFNEADKEIQQKVREKLAGHDFSHPAINSFFDRIRFTELEEGKITAEVADIIKGTIGGAQPDVTSDLLTKWISNFSETRSGFTKNTLVAQIHHIGEFLKDLKAHYSTWFTVIKPFSEFNLNNSDKEALEESFIEGTSARFEHILLGLDVIRQNQLDLISAAFKDRSIVIVHGASGQGKTTLALRYINEYHPIELSFYIKKILDYEASVDISTALIEYALKLGIPILIYYDVEAYNPYWANVLDQLSSKKNIKILITIREENWRMSDLSSHAFPFKDIDLIFNQEEAHEIFEKIRQKHTIANALDFQDSWNNFGGQGPLLEYVYYLRKTQTLKSRLKAQLLTLEKNRSKEYLDFLAVISLITKYGVRVNLKKILDFTSPQSPMNLLVELEKEYLIRIIHEPSLNLIEAMHPIRSNIIYEILFEDGIYDWFEYFKKSFALVHRNDLQFYLLNQVYDHFNVLGEISSFFLSYNLKTWNELYAMYKALQWADIKNYYLQNQLLINELFDKLYRAWSVVLDFNIARVRTSNTWPHWKNFDELSKNFDLQCYYKRQSSKLEAFPLSEQLLKNISNFCIDVESDEDWLKVSEVIFLSYYFEVPTSIEDIIKNTNFNDFLSFPIEILSKIILAFFESKNVCFIEWYTTHKKKILDIYKEQMEIEKISEDEETIKIEFFWRWINSTDNESETISLHDKNLKKLMMLRELVPDKDVYASDAYGQVIISEGQPDDLQKRIGREHLPHTYLPEINSNFIGIVNYQYRMNEWKDYYLKIRVQRERIKDILENIIGDLKIYFSKKKIVNTSFIDEFIDKLSDLEIVVSQDVLLPKTAVDRFGFNFEGKRSPIDSPEGSINCNYINSCASAKNNLTKRFDYYGKYLDYRTSLNNFLDQAKKIFRYNSMMNKIGKKIFTSLETPKKPTLENINHLSLINLKDSYRFILDFQNSFKRLFYQFILADGEDEYKKLENQEIKCFNVLLPIWFNLAYNPDKTLSNAHWMNENYINNFLSNQLENIKVLINRDCSKELFIKDSRETIIDGDKLVFFQCDLKSLIDLDFILKKTEKALFNYFRDVKFDSLCFYIMDIYRRRFIFLFTFKNKIIYDSVITISLLDIINKQSIFENIILSLIPLDQIKKSFTIHLTPFEDEFIIKTREATSKLSELIGLFKHFCKCHEFPFEEDSSKYDYLITIEKKLVDLFISISHILEKIETQCIDDSSELSQSLKNFRGCYFVKPDQEGGVKIVIDQVIPLTLALINELSANMLNYIKEKYSY